MSDPWLKIYPSDMRADPKLDGLNADMQLALIHGWDIAKNGPGDPCDLRASEGGAMRERELRRIANVSPSATRRMFERWARRGLCELVHEEGETLCTFPNLAKRQGIDRTAAERKRRQRERQRHGVSRQSHGESHGQMSRHVTGENQSTEELTRDLQAGGLSKVSSSRNLVDPIWKAFTEHHPQAALTPARRELVKRRLRDFPPETLIAAIHGNHADPWCNGENPGGKTYHALELILRDADKIEKYAAIHHGANGANGKKRMTMEEANRIAEEHRFGVQFDQPSSPPHEEELPY